MLSIHELLSKKGGLKVAREINQHPLLMLLTCRLCDKYANSCFDSWIILDEMLIKHSHAAQPEVRLFRKLYGESALTLSKWNLGII